MGQPSRSAGAAQLAALTSATQHTHQRRKTGGSSGSAAAAAARQKQAGALQELAGLGPYLLCPGTTTIAELRARVRAALPSSDAVPRELFPWWPADGDSAAQAGGPLVRLSLAGEVRLPGEARGRRGGVGSAAREGTAPADSGVQAAPLTASDLAGWLPDHVTVAQLQHALRGGLQEVVLQYDVVQAP